MSRTSKWRRLRSVQIILGLSLVALMAVSPKTFAKLTDAYEDRATEAVTGSGVAGRARLAEHPLSKDIDALAAKVGTESLQILDVTVTEASVTASVQDPAKPENVDHYTLGADGSWGAPEPVDLVGSGTVEGSVFPAKSVAWDSLDGLADQAVQKVGVEGGELSNISVRRAMDGEVEISVFVDGTREDGSLTAGPDGKGATVSKS